MGDPVCLCCLDEQMAYQALSELKPGVKNWNVCVHVSHLWEYRGGTDTGPVQHVDMVLVNNKGNAMYAEIGKDDLEHKAPLLADGNTYTLTRFMVSLATLLWKQWLTSKMAFWSSCTTLFRFWTSQPMWERTSALYCWVIVHQLLKFIAKFSEHPNGKVLLWKMGIARVLNKLLKNCSNASYLEDKAISERGAYRSDQLMLKWRIPLFRCLASIFSAQPSGKEQTAIEELSLYSLTGFSILFLQLYCQ
ncbi:uncharacterized protein [Triticum aestivum]|uniref:uncharacterized protein isoform X2 n=1 Tax=Triticum aestivum TaxID=4565 RepID=UPI001D0045FC|nr:uncharacterized protein LOC123048642 isoform X2 [Triticum aestivum]